MEYLNDFELFEAMNAAGRRYDELALEFRKLGLYKKLFCMFSKQAPTYHICGKCGAELQIVRPGKYQCPNCE